MVPEDVEGDGTCEYGDEARVSLTSTSKLMG